MKLDQFFRHRGNNAPQQFWEIVASLCTGHVQNTLQTFQKRGWPRLDFSSKMYLKLVEPNEMSRLIRVAQEQYGRTRNSPSSHSIEVAITDFWHIRTCVYPSARDQDFLAACSAGRFGEVVRQAKKESRTSVPKWWGYHFALWVLLLDPAQNCVSVHLQTDWAFRHKATFWSRGGEGGEPISIEAPPLIIAEELLDEAHVLMDQLFREDCEAFQME